MSARVIPFTLYPLGSIDHIRRAGGMIREWSTAYRGLIAFVGCGKVWALSELVDVKPVAWANGGFLWCFQTLRMVEGITAPLHYSEGAKWETSRGPEPQFLAAGSSHYLELLLAGTPRQEGQRVYEVEMAFRRLEAVPIIDTPAVKPKKARGTSVARVPDEVEQLKAPSPEIVPAAPETSAQVVEQFGVDLLDTSAAADQSMQMTLF